MKYCDVCKRSMTYLTLEGKETSLTGVRIAFMFNDNALSKKGFYSIYPELRKNEYNVCFVCWLKSLGVKLPIVKPTIAMKSRTYPAKKQAVVKKKVVKKVGKK